MELLSVQIFAVGTWNGFKFVETDLQEIVKNTNELLKSGRVKPPLKLGHSNNQILKGQSDGDPALGWAENFRLQDGKVTADFRSIPEVVHSAISKGLYRQVSVEMKHVDHLGWLITAVALLGADLPAVKTLDDLQAFLSEKETESSEELEELCFSEPKILTKKVDMTQIDELEKKLKEAEEKLHALSVKENEMRFASETEKILSPYRDDVKAGKLSPACFSKIESHVKSQSMTFSEKGIVIAPEVMREIAVGYSQALPVGEVAGNETIKDKTIDQVVVEEIYKIMGSTGKNYSESSLLLFKSRPELANEYKQFTAKIHG